MPGLFARIPAQVYLGYPATSGRPGRPDVGMTAPLDLAADAAPPHYPLALDLRGRRAVVVGGGTVALRRTRGLLGSGANVVVIAPEVVPELAALPVTVLRRSYRAGGRTWPQQRA